MNATRLAWACWALAPVGVVAYHFGPGQPAYVQDRAARLQVAALSAESKAIAAQDVAYTQHLNGIDARRKAFLSQSPEDEALATKATAAEDQAYALAGEAWKEASANYGHVEEVLGNASKEEARKVRWAKARSTVRSGDVWGGITELEELIDELDQDGQGSSALATSAREELATAYYYGARLLRLSGMPAQEWHIESGKARQQFRFLAEQTKDGDPASAENYQKNLELVLNLEQSSLVEVQGKALPKNSPGNCNMCNRAGNGKPKKNKLPPRKKDARGGGGMDDIRDGW